MRVQASAAVAILLSVGLVASACSSYYAQQATLPHAYLEQAKQAVEARDAPQALAALDRAENAMLVAATPSRNPILQKSVEVVREIAEARQSIGMQRWSDAAYYINTALTDPDTLIPR